MRNIDRFRGCLIGGASGDALGYAVEFMSEPQIFRTYGERGITEYSLTDGLARFSDDTQMTLFTANGLLYGTAKNEEEGINREYRKYIRKMYRCWYKTQTEKYPASDGENEAWLLNVPELFTLRAPGTTCMSSIAAGAYGKVSKPINHSKGCGGVMRVAPIGLYFCDRDTPEGYVDVVAAEAAALTHGHEMGYIPASALAHIVRAAAENSDMTLREAIEDAIRAQAEIFSDAIYIDEFTELMNRAISLAYSDTDDLKAIHSLGEGWVGDEALAIAIYCALKYENDFDKALIAAVNHKGDSDSTGAVAGNILGAYIGYEAIPQKYKDDLELRDLILELADDLYEYCMLSSDDLEKVQLWRSKYLTATYGK